MRGLKDKVVIITGGAGGIGTALSARFAAEGSKVAIFDLNAASADAVVDGIKTNGGTAIGCAVDITDHDAVNEAVARIEATLGPVDVLVNSAGVLSMLGAEPQPTATPTRTTVLSGKVTSGAISVKAP